MKRIIFILFLLAIGAFLPAQSGDMAMYEAMYDGSRNISEQVMVFEQVAASKPAGSTDFFAKALNDLILAYPRQSDINEINAADRAGIILSRALGEANYTDAAPGLSYIVQEFNGSQDAPLAKAAALEALGKISAMDYIQQVVTTLNDMNSRPPSDRQTQIQYERVAYGAILGLENYRDPAGYNAVFLASLSWYSQRVRNQAEESHAKIMDDPYEHLISIINTPSYAGLALSITPVEVKYEALKAADESNSTPAHKSMVAIAALNQSFIVRTNDKHQQGVISSMRKLALSMIRNYGTDDETAFPLVERSYHDGDHDEKIAALQTLGSIGGANSAEILSGYLRELHGRRVANGGTQRQQQDEDNYVRIIIAALGNIGAPARDYAPPVLRLIQNTSVWTGTVQRLAREAIQKIG